MLPEVTMRFDEKKMCGKINKSLPILKASQLRKRKSETQKV
jgi:hypothetical protein